MSIVPKLETFGVGRLTNSHSLFFTNMVVVKCSAMFLHPAELKEYLHFYLLYLQ